jgi:hypothetical protein
MVPKGRDEDDLPFDMAWVRHHDRYATGGELLDADRPYWPKFMATEAASQSTSTGSCCGNK